MMRRTRILTMVAITLLLAAPLMAQAPQPLHHAGGLDFAVPSGSYEAITLIVSGPDGLYFTREFGPEEMPSLGLEDGAGNALPDGLYNYELRISPRISDETRQRMEAAREAGDDGIVEVLRAEGMLPAEKSVYRSGFFTIEGGAILSPDLEEPPRAVRGAGPDSGPAAGTDKQIVGVSEEVVLTNADGVIRNSLCVGFDCPNNPSFSDTTILLMENNTRIKFDDTSVIGGFPNRDWELEANSNVNGGPNRFTLNDCDTSSQGGCANDPVFAVEANVRQNALYVESDGDVGVGTSNPVLELHAVRGDSPGLRLEQDSSSGFTPQTWDVVGNETNFFVRDVTNGSQLPFRIQPGADTNAIFIANNNEVGIGTASPDAPLDVENVGESFSFFRLTAPTASPNTAVDVTFTDAGADGELRINIVDGDNEELSLDHDGNLTVDGTVTTATQTIPDYVFEPDYELMSLSELAEFIQREKHLPNVPSDAEVKAKGSLNLNEMQLALLEKIEELTLYTLQQQDHILRQERALATREQESAQLMSEIAELRAVVERLASQ